MFCKHCGTQNDEGAQFCQNCGKSLVRRELTPEQKRALLERKRKQEEERLKAEKKAKTKKIVKWSILGFLLFVFVMFSFAMCKACSNVADSLEEEFGSTAGEGGSSSASHQELKPGQIGDYIVTVKDSVVCKNDQDGTDIIVVTYTFTNNSTEDAAPTGPLTFKASQNGVQLSDVYTNWGIENYYTDLDTHTREVKPGVSVDFQDAYELNDVTSEVVIDIEEWLTWADAPTLTYTIDIAE